MPSLSLPVRGLVSTAAAAAAAGAGAWLGEGSVPAVSAAALMAALATSVAFIALVVRPARRALAATDRGLKGAGIADLPVRGGISELDLTCGRALDTLAVARAEAAETARRLDHGLAECRRELEQAREQARSSEQGRAGFLANVGHEIRTPLTGVLSVADLLRRAALPPGPRRQVEVIVSSGHALLRVLDDLIELATTGSGHLSIEQVAFRPRDVLDEVLQLHAARACAKGLRLRWSLDRSLSQPILGDPDRLGQVVGNLLSNAVKFTPRGDVELSATLAEREPGHRKLVIGVRDTGPGIPRERLERVFQPFAPLHADDAGAQRGAGLGLSIVHGLVQAMGGRIQVDSRPGRGTLFAVNLPAAVPHEDSPPTRPASVVDASAWVLVADPTLRAELVEQLAFLGVTIAEASLDPLALAQAKPDFLFVDATAWGALVAGPTDPAPAGARVFLVLAPGVPATRGPAHAGLAGVLAAPWREAELWRMLSELPQPRPAARQAQRGSEGSRPVRILVVEDDRVGAEALKDMLALGGAQVSLAGAAADALGRVRQAGFDAVFMDLRMPLIDGFEAIRSLRAAEAAGELAPAPSPRRWSRLPVIATTAGAARGDRERCLAAGFDDYLRKPFDVDRVLELLRTWTSAEVPERPSQPQVAGASRPRP